MSEGHGHVIPRRDGVKARCGGPAMCSVCQEEWGKLHTLMNDPKAQFAVHKIIEEFNLIPKEARWPKRIAVSIGSDKEYMLDEGKEIGLTGEALSLFRHALCEVTVDIDVNEDGTYTIARLKE